MRTTKSLESGMSADNQLTKGERSLSELKDSNPELATHA